jgi:hypothetical protein
MMVKQEDKMSQKKSIQVSYTVKEDSGYIIDKSKKFSSVHDAVEFVQMFKHLMVGKPTMNWSNSPK